MYRLLIAEDEAIIRGGLERALDWRALGFELVATAEDGVEALEILRTHRLDVLLTDVKMPGMDGLETLRTIKREQPGIEVVVVTGYADFAYAKEALKHHAFDYVLKMDILKELQPVMERLRFELDARRVNMNEAHPVYLALARSDVSAFTAVAPCMQPLLVRGEEGCIATLLSQRVPENCRARLSNALFGALMCAKTREQLAGKADALCDAIAASGGMAILGIPAISIQGLDRSCRLVRKTLDFVLLHPERAACRVDAEQIEWPGVAVDLKAQAHAIAQSLAGTDEAETGMRVDEMLNAIIDTPDRTVFDARLCLLDAFFRAAAALPQQLGQPYVTFLSEINTLASIRDLSEAAKRYAVVAMQSLQDNDAGNSVIGKALRYMADNFTKNLRMEEVARRFYMSPAYFSRCFKQCVGVGFTDHLKRLRMEWAKHLLEETDMRVSDVAREAGYADIKHFTHLFRETFGMLPSTARGGKA